jgi:hypothetical protein
MAKVFIYCLEMDGVPVYIGSTENFERRLKNHQQRYKGCTGFVLNEFEWKDSIFANERGFWEYHFIWLFRSFGFKLDNVQIKKGTFCAKSKRQLSEGVPFKQYTGNRNYKDHEIEMNKRIFKNYN